MPSVTAALLSKDADTSGIGPDEHLFGAALRGDLHTVRSLLTNGADPNGHRDRYGCSALIVAARGGFHRLCAALIGAGAQIDASDICGATALMAAVRKVHPEIVRLLLLAGASTEVDGKPVAVGLLSSGAHSSTQAERAIRQMLTGAADLGAIDKCRMVAAAAEQHRAVEAERCQALVAEAERAAAESRLKLEAARTAAQHEVERRRLDRPHAWVGAAPSRGAVKVADLPSGIGGIGVWGMGAGAKAGGTVGVGPAVGGAGPSIFPWEVATSKGQGGPAPMSSRDAQKRMAWRQHWDPLHGRARPDCDSPAQKASWCRKEQRWVQASPPLAEQASADPVSTMSAFARDVTAFASGVRDLSVPSVGSASDVAVSSVGSASDVSV